MRYLFRLLVYLAIFGFTFSVGAVILLRFLPVTVTPLKVLRMVENFPDKGFSIRSNWVSLEEINPTMIRAVIATEDNHLRLLSAPPQLAPQRHRSLLHCFDRGFMGQTSHHGGLPQRDRNRGKHVWRGSARPPYLRQTGLGTQPP